MKVQHTCFALGLFVIALSSLWFTKISFKHVQVEASDVTGSVSELEAAVSGLNDLTKGTPKRKAEEKGNKDKKDKKSRKK